MSEFHTEAPHATASEELPKIPTWRLERNLNPRPFGQKATNLPMVHHAPLDPCMHLNPIRYIMLQYSTTKYGDIQKRQVGIAAIKWVSTPCLITILTLHPRAIRGSVYHRQEEDIRLRSQDCPHIC